MMSYKPQNPGAAATGRSPRWFFRTLRPPHSSFEQKINTGDVSEANFNPQFLSH